MMTIVFDKMIKKTLVIIRFNKVMKIIIMIVFEKMINRKLTMMIVFDKMMRS